MRIRLLLGVSILLTPLAHAAEPVVFETHILPLLETRCIKCHGGDKIRGGLDLRRKFTMLKGGDGGPALVPGKPEASSLLTRVEQNEMPPPEEGKLAPRQRDLLRAWIRAGAPVARSPEPPLDDREEVSRLSKEDRAFWAFQPPRRSPVPAVQAADRVRTPLDAFLLARLEAKGMSFQPDASKAVLLRRLTFGLLGLPPTLEQQADFLADERPDAYDRLVDRLLASPAYGERWGRHWLDLAGYADTDGYLDADRPRPEAWRYRDYVLRSLNDDTPYDRFLTEQLAGDEMSDWRRAPQLTPDMARQLTATGFLRTALDPTYPGYTEPNEIHQVLSDTMQIVSSTTLGLTLQCARCHGHKFDPISQRDYYAFQAVFLPALDPARWQPSGVRGIPLASEPEQARLKQEQAKLAGRIADLQKQLAALPGTDPKKPAPNANRAEIERVKTALALATAEQARLAPVHLRGLTDLDGKLPEARLLKRGEYSKPGAVVEANVPEVLAPPGYRLQPAPAPRTSGRRLALARWLTAPEHPLTARAQVNRLWAHHFGRGIVPTVANLGRSGASPSHPELLDWLAIEFVRSGWSLKAIHRLVVTSTVYRQSSQRDRAAVVADPDNVLLGSWRPRRHEGEVVRDSLLSVSGKLNGQRFGPPAPVSRGGEGAVETADDPAGNRRSVYVIVKRSQHLTLLDLFDTPLMEVNCPERTVSTVPLQALALLHGPFAERSAAALANRLLALPAPARIDHAYRLLFARPPKPGEVKQVETFLSALAAEKLPERTAWTQLALVLLNSNEFVYVH